VTHRGPFQPPPFCDSVTKVSLIHRQCREALEGKAPYLHAKPTVAGFRYQVRPEGYACPSGFKSMTFLEKKQVEKRKRQEFISNKLAPFFFINKISILSLSRRRAASCYLVPRPPPLFLPPLLFCVSVSIALSLGF